MKDRYPFKVTLSDLIEKLTKLKEEHGNIWVESFAEGCYSGMNVTYQPRYEDSVVIYEEVVLIGEKP